MIDWKSCSQAGVAGFSCIPLIISTLIYWLLVFSGVVSVFFIIFSGFKYITSGGDPKQLDSAKKTLIYAIGGLVLILCAFLIIETIAKITGISCVNSFISIGFGACK